MPARIEGAEESRRHAFVSGLAAILEYLSNVSLWKGLALLVIKLPLIVVASVLLV